MKRTDSGRRSPYVRRSTYLKRFITVLIVSIILTAAGSLILSSLLNSSTYTTVLSGELISAHTQGKRLAESYARGDITAEDCQDKFDSVLNSSRAFWIIYIKTETRTETETGESVQWEYKKVSGTAEADTLAAYLIDPEKGKSQLDNILMANEETIRELIENAARKKDDAEETGDDTEEKDDSSKNKDNTEERDLLFVPSFHLIDIPDELDREMVDVAVVAEEIGDVVLVTGLPHAIYEVPFADTRLRMLTYVPLLMLLVLLISTLFTRGVARPAMQLIDAADQIKQGQLPVLPENLYGEAGEIATAFNYLTMTVNETLAALQYEKETLGLVINGLHEGIIASDNAGKQLFVNSAARDLLGDEKNGAWQTVKKALKAGCSGIVTDKIVLGGTQVLQYTISPLPKREGESAGRVALIRDITEQELLENTRHDYVANISHELRTPLASIRGLGEGLRDGLVTEQADRDRYYNIIVDEANRLSRLVNDLLELSGLQSNPAAFETEKVDLTEMLYDLYDLNGSIFEEKEITFTLDVPEEPLPVVISNEDRLSQVLTILLDNARKYTPRGGAVILGGEKKKNSVRIYVKDTGIGMDEETRKMAFERFHQAEKSHSEKGSGLGLAIAREVMQKLGLTIQLVSAPGKGSEFSFEIPLN